MRPGERQVAPTVEGIRADHVERYRFAAGHAGQVRTVADVGCGVGYGTWLLAQAGLLAFGFDVDAEAVDYAREHYAHPRAGYSVLDVSGGIPRPFDAAVAFEVIEHLADPAAMLVGLSRHCKVLYASVPNEECIPYHPGIEFHYRHYTPAQFNELLCGAGWDPVEWWGQADDTASPEPVPHGRTLIAVARTTHVP